jgi:Winged helix DNA-binding domain
VAHRDLRDGAQAHRLSAEVLSRRELNRALLARQHLLERAGVSALDMVEHLVGLQAQDVMPPYEGLWSRVETFDPNELGRLLEERRVVRLTLMRGTVHLVSVRDALALRPLLQPVIERTHNGAFGRRMGGADPKQLAAAVRELLAAEPLGARELGRRLVERGIGDDPEAIGNATRVYAALVQVPPRGVWGKSGRPLYTTLESWTGRELETDPSLDDLVLRYLGAFGPASVIDMQSWCGLTRLRDAVQRLCDRLVSFRDEDGKELFDLPEAPRPDPDTPSPVRFFGQYDNVLLGHKDRRRVIPPDFAWAEMLAPGRFFGSVLVDGILRAAWWLERDDRATLVIRPDRGFTRRERQEVIDEAGRMAAFRQAGDVRFEEPVR